MTFRCFVSGIIIAGITAIAQRYSKRHRENKSADRIYGPSNESILVCNMQNDYQITFTVDRVCFSVFIDSR